MNQTQPATPGPTLLAPRGWWPHLRAALILLHLVAVTLMSLPAPGEGMVRSAWKDPNVQEEFAAWTARLNRWGVEITPSEFEDRLWRAAETYATIWGKAHEPFDEYYALCGTMQSWRMFAGPHRYPTRLEIDVEQDGRWRAVYVQRNPEYDWLRARLDHYRFRPVLYRFGWYHDVPGYADYENFANWVSAHARGDFPAADRVRVRLYKARTASPEETRAGRQPAGEYVKTTIRDLKRTNNAP